MRILARNTHFFIRFYRDFSVYLTMYIYVRTRESGKRQILDRI